MAKAIHRVNSYGEYTISPSHVAGKANVTRYFGILAYLLKGLLIAAVVLAAAAAVMVAARGIVGVDLVPARIAARLATIDRTETAAMLLGLALALSVGVPMGLYLHGLMAGYHEFPDED